MHQIEVLLKFRFYGESYFNKKEHQFFSLNITQLAGTTVLHLLFCMEFVVLVELPDKTWPYSSMNYNISCTIMNMDLCHKDIWPLLEWKNTYLFTS